MDDRLPTGRFMRNIHRWAAHAMVVCVILHMARAFYTAAYKVPRQFNWVIGMVLLVLTLGLSFTGYLLPWDQLAFWAVMLVLGYDFDAPLKEVANPLVPENQAKAPWYFLGIQELVSYSAFAGGVGMASETETPLPPSPIHALAAQSKPRDLAGKARRRGSRVFAQYCVICHGTQGAGDGFNSTKLKPQPVRADVRRYEWTRLCRLLVSGVRELSLFQRKLLPSRPVLLRRKTVSQTVVPKMAAGARGTRFDAGRLCVRMPISNRGTRVSATGSDHAP